MKLAIPVNNTLRKRRNIVLTALFLSLLLFSSSSHAQMLSDWEFNVYYDFIDRFLDMDDWTEENEDKVSREIASKYNLTYEQVNEIVDRAFKREISDWEWDIGEEIYERFSSVPEELQTDNERERIFREFGNKYDISRNYLNDILYRTIWDIMMWDYFD